MLKTEERKKLYKHLTNYETDQQLLDAERIAYKVLPFIQRGITQHTFHGIDHSTEVIRYINKLIEILRDEGFDFSQTEIKLLYLSGWLHDIGNIKDNREKHSIESCNLINKLENNYIVLEELKRFLEYIVKYHQSKFDLAEVPTDVYMVGEDKIRLSILAPLFRLADACHMGKDRAFRVVYFLIQEDLEDDSKEHWQANEAIMSVNFDITTRKIEIYVLNKERAKILTEGFEKEFDSVKVYLRKYFPFDKVQVIEVPKTKIRDY